MIQDLFGLKDWFIEVGFGAQELLLTELFIWIMITGLLAWIADFISIKILIGFIGKLVKKSTSSWDDTLMEQKVFHKIAHFAPLMVVYGMAPIILQDLPEKATNFLQAGINIFMIVVFLQVINALLNGIKAIYQSSELSSSRPITGYLQVVRIISYGIGVIWIVGIVMGKNPIALLTGLSAMAAILLLVFKDTILGFVASIQLSANDMVKVGDWISMPKHGADGTVLEITLNTVKVQNWDKTISTIPTYSLISEAFSNWRGMEESNGRRIKRSIYIDMTTVKFCSREMLNRFREIELVGEYIEKKEKEIEMAQQKIDGVFHRSRKITNIGTFRKYLENYLMVHPFVHKNMTLIVRQLQPGEFGIPIEVYAFSNKIDWVEYEGIQSDIFDHILAIVPSFDLSVFQRPAGRDFHQN